MGEGEVIEDEVARLRRCQAADSLSEGRLSSCAGGPNIRRYPTSHSLSNFTTFFANARNRKVCIMKMMQFEYRSNSLDEHRGSRGCNL